MLSYWLKYRKVCVPYGVPIELVELMKMAFYAGGGSMIGLLTESSDTDRVIQNAIDEIDGFKAEIIRGKLEERKTKARTKTR